MRFLLSRVENNSHYYIGTRSLVQPRASRRRRKRRAVARTQSPLHCVPEGIAIPYSPSSGERQPATSRIHPSMMFSVSASRCLPKLPLSFALRYRTRGWDARRNAAILLQINHARIVAVAPAVVGAIVLPRFVSLGLVNSSPTPLARAQNREQMGRDYCIACNFFRGRKYSRLAYARQ